MGDFTTIRVPSKYAARMGQTFSSTVGTVILDDVDITMVDDIATKDCVRGLLLLQILCLTLEKSGFY